MFSDTIYEMDLKLMYTMILATLLTSLFFVFISIKIAHKKSWFDPHDERKIHNGEVPRLGGIGFASAFILTSIVLVATSGNNDFGRRLVPIFIAMPLIVTFGVVDDFKQLRPRYKLFVQILASCLVLSYGFRFDTISLPVIELEIKLGWIGYIITLVWIVGVTNALNLLDGVDGLAGGTSALIALTMGLIFHAEGNDIAFLLCLVLVAAIAGFLFFNLPLPKARIFMGDSGSQFLGFTLAVLPLLDNGKSGETLTLPFAAALLIIPIFDTFAAIWRRLRDGMRIDSPDRAHLHHKLMNLGLNARGVIGVVYSLQICFGFLVFHAKASAGSTQVLLIISVYLIAGAFFTLIHYMNRATQ